jgi:hypothetical protein
MLLRLASGMRLKEEEDPQRREELLFVRLYLSTW